MLTRDRRSRSLCVPVSHIDYILNQPDDEQSRLPAPLSVHACRPALRRERRWSARERLGSKLHVCAAQRQQNDPYNKSQDHNVLIKYCDSAGNP